MTTGRYVVEGDPVAHPHPVPYSIRDTLTDRVEFTHLTRTFAQAIAARLNRGHRSDSGAPA